MGEGERIFEDPDRGVTVEVEPGCTEAFIDHVSRTCWGTEGLLYRMEGVEAELSLAKDPVTVCARERGQVVGVYGLMQKTVAVGSYQLPTLYRMLLTVLPEHAGRGYGRLLVEQTRNHFLKPGSGPLMVYGYIESANTRSLRISEAVGYQRVGTFTSVLISRLSPRPTDAIEQPIQREEILSLLGEAYCDHAMADFEHSVRLEDYWVLRRDGAIVAGVQASARRWQLVQLPGWHGRFVLPLLQYVPLISRFLDGSDFPHLFLGNIYAPPGQELAFFELVEGLLHKFGLHMAMAFADTSCPMLARLRQSGGLGLMNQMGVDSEAEVMAGFVDVPPEVVQQLTTQPLVISPIDPT